MHSSQLYVHSVAFTCNLVLIQAVKWRWKQHRLVEKCSLSIMYRKPQQACPFFSVDLTTHESQLKLSHTVCDVCKWDIRTQLYLCHRTVTRDVFFSPKWFVCVRALLSTSSCIIYSKHHCFSFTVIENLTGKNIKIIFFPACACTCLCICVYLSAWEGNKKENRAGICLWCRNALFSTPLNRSNAP